MPRGLKQTLEFLDRRIRTIERKYSIVESRHRQMVVMLKMILDRVTLGRDRGKGKNKITIQDILKSLDFVVRDNLPPEEEREPPDLISELIKKGKVD